MDNIRDNMVKSNYRYQKEHYKRVHLRVELWRWLSEEAGKLNMSIPSFIEYLFNEYIKLKTSTASEQKKEIKEVKGLTRFGVR
jgi:hypothetical protein